LDYKKTDITTARPDGFNILNIPTELYKSPDQFCEEYNKPFLDVVIQRGNNFLAITFMDENTTGIMEYFIGCGREINNLIENGYKHDPVTSQMIKGE
jgi:hypothetical protein